MLRVIKETGWVILFNYLSFITGFSAEVGSSNNILSFGDGFNAATKYLGEISTAKDRQADQIQTIQSTK